MPSNEKDKDKEPSIMGLKFNWGGGSENGSSGNSSNRSSHDSSRKSNSQGTIQSSSGGDYLSYILRVSGLVLLITLVTLLFTEIIFDCSILNNRYLVIGLFSLIIIPLIIFPLLSGYRIFALLATLMGIGAICLLAYMVLTRTTVRFYIVELNGKSFDWSALKDLSFEKRGEKILGMGIPEIDSIKKKLDDTAKTKGGVRIFILSVDERPIDKENSEEYIKTDGQEYTKDSIKKAYDREHKKGIPVLVLPIVSTSWTNADSLAALRKINETYYSHLGTNYSMILGMFKMNVTALNILNRRAEVFTTDTEL